MIPDFLRLPVRAILKSTFWRDGTIRNILVGPSSGLRYRIFPEYGLGPVFGRWEPRLQHLLAQLLREGDVVFDVGANYGIHSLLMARLVGGSGKVYSFEPHPQIFRSCIENIGLNGFQNVEVLDIALSDQRGEVRFSEGHHEGAGHVISSDREAPAFKVKCDTIDNLVSTGRVTAPQLMKLDVEGHEATVLAGADQTFKLHRPILAIDLHTPEQDERVGRFLLRHGYMAFRQADLSRIPRLDLGWPAPDGIQGTVLAIHPEKAKPFPLLRV
jgi:FkbM family methyltransferase